ncbi:MAG TPA: hypothetical protein VGN20_01640 [Mucilaginibacter sp.]|jgi:hypothetical protein
MKSFSDKVWYDENKIAVEQSEESDLTKEIALALLEAKQMQEGKIQSSCLRDI